MATTDFTSPAPKPHIIRWLSKLPQLSQIQYSCLPSKLDRHLTKMEGDDPWHWSVDRVVQEFCTSRRSWELRAASTPLPDPTFLEHALRDNAVSGDVLLLEIDDKIMRKGLKIEKIGWRSFIRYGIEQLRSRSPKYHAWFSEQSIQAGPISEHSGSFRGFPLNTDFNFTINSPGPIPTGSGNQNNSGLQPLQLLTNSRTGSPATHRNRTADGVSDASSSKRQKLNDHSSHQNDVDSSEVTVTGHQEVVLNVDAQNDTTEHEADQTKKRKRVAPTLVTAIVDTSINRSIPTEADSVRIHRQDRSSSSLNTLDGESIEAKDPEALGYLGLERLSVDDVFYSDTAVGERIESEDIAAFEGQSNARIPSGRRLYVHGLMRRFLLAQPDTFERNQKTYVALRPYPRRLALTSQNVSFTLYQPTTDNEIAATRENLSLWPEIDPGVRVARPPKAGEFIFGVNSNSEDPRFQPEASDLIRYNTLDDDDELLPAWGDSEYDSEELDFFDAAAEEHENDQTLKENKYLTPEEINSIIDDGIADLVTKWLQTKLPKRRQKAFRLWRMSRRNGTKRAQIQKAKSELTHLVQKRLPQLREHVLDCQWSEIDGVRRQTGSFEATIFDREDLIYTIALLESTTPPPKPVKELATNAKDNTLRSYESDSGESINSDSSHIESVDAMSDFVVEELDLADDEEDVTMSDTGEIEPPQTPSTSTSQTSSRTTTQTTTGPNKTRPYSQGNSQDDSLGSPVPFDTPVVAGIKNEPTLTQRYHTPLIPVGASKVISLISSDEGTPPSGRLKIKLINRKSPITVSSSSDKEHSHKTLPLDMENLPSFTTPASISQYEYHTWENLKDRNRLIITVVYGLPNAHQIELLSFVASLNRDTCRTYIEDFIGSSDSVKESDADLLSALKTIVRLFWIYIDCKFHAEQQGWFQAACIVIGKHWHMYNNFFILAYRLESYFNPKIRLNYSSKEVSSVHNTTVDDESEDDAPLSAVRRRPRTTM
jgi:hypothetical protein